MKIALYISKRLHKECVVCEMTLSVVKSQNEESIECVKKMLRLLMRQAFTRGLRGIL